MSLTLQKQLLCLGETNDGGMNYDTCTIPLLITKQYVNDEYEIVVEGLRDDKLIWTQEEHCYTWYKKEGIIYDSEGDLPDYVQDNLEAIKEYFGTREDFLIAQESAVDLERRLQSVLSHYGGWMFNRQELLNKIKRELREWNKDYFAED